MSAPAILGALAVAAVAGGGALSVLVQRRLLKPWVARKVAHVSFGAAVLGSWIFFPATPWARLWAALPPLVGAAYFGALASGRLRHASMVRAGSRRGDPRGLLAGPLGYMGVFAAFTLIFWRHRPEGIAALAFLVFGDAAAELVGRWVPSPALPLNRRKTLAGTLAAWGAGWLAGWRALAAFAAAGYLPGPAAAYGAPAAAVALAGALAESLPAGEADNVVAPVAGAVVGLVVFG